MAPLARQHSALAHSARLTWASPAAVLCPLRPSLLLPPHWGTRAGKPQRDVAAEGKPGQWWWGGGEQGPAHQVVPQLPATRQVPFHSISGPECIN